jgi:hypothetical protein
VKGLHLDSDEAAKELISSGGGLTCAWWRRVNVISPSLIRDRLTVDAADRHVNHFDVADPVSGLTPAEDSPFISLSAGTVSRDAALRTNTVVRARQTALWFGSAFGIHPYAYLFLCWTLLSPRQAVPVEGVSEEVRDLNTYRRYSEFQPEGEILAKVVVPGNQVVACEKWELAGMPEVWKLADEWRNPDATNPEVLSNVREVI